MNKYDYAKEEIYNAIWELCGRDDDVYQNACSGLPNEEMVDTLCAIAAKLDGMSQRYERGLPVDHGDYMFAKVTEEIDNWVRKENCK